MDKQLPEQAKPKHQASLWDVLAQTASNMVNLATAQVEQTLTKTTTEIGEAINTVSQEAGKAIAKNTIEFGKVTGTATGQAGKAIASTNILLSGAVGTTIESFGEVMVATASGTKEIAQQLRVPIHPLLQTAATMTESVGSATIGFGKAIAEEGAVASDRIERVADRASTSIIQTSAGAIGLLDEAIGNAEQIRLKVSEIGGGFAGAIAGETLGGAIGGIAGSVVFGPAGAVLGSQMGGFAGFVIGAQVGEETVTQLHKVSQQPQNISLQFDEKLKRNLQKRGGEKVGDTVGAIIGGAMGSIVFGRTGALVGSSIGGAFGGQICEDFAIRLNSPTNSSSNSLINSAHQLSENPIDTPTPVWIGNTTTIFVGETITTTVGGIVGGMVLGLEGRQLGRKFGTFVGKKVDWGNGLVGSDRLNRIDSSAVAELEISAV